MSGSITRNPGRSPRRGAAARGAPATAPPAPESPPQPSPSAAIADAGIRTSLDFGHVFSRLIADVLNGRTTPQVCRAAVQAGNVVLRNAELQQRYGTPIGGSDQLQIVYSEAATAVAASTE
jgi:hypothetical protein